MTAGTETRIIRFTDSLCITGFLLGTLFFAYSLTPSLLPRTWVMQGVLSGLSFAAGYGLGVFSRWLWHYLQLPRFVGRAHLVAVIVAAVFCGATMVLFLWKAGAWQDSIRSLMEQDPIDSAHHVRVGLIAILVFTGVLSLARLFGMTYGILSRRLGRWVPHRISVVIGVLLTVMLFWTVIDGVLFRQALRSFDASFQRIDALIESELEPPTDPARTGSAESLVAWEDLGRRGREYIVSGPGAEELTAWFGTPLPAPIRVYVGLNSGETIEERVSLAMAELERVGAWNRSVLVLITPTGTGWVDPSASDTLEYLHRGDIASLAVQYSYLPSWLSLLAEPEYGAETARAVFAAVYQRWTELPQDERPRLYLHGLSLGALNSERAADIYDVIADPFHGALWSGPPFRSEAWRTFTAQRHPDSPAWLPRFRDGSIVRFTNQTTALEPPDAQWGPLRIVYLQYASDPITFFDPTVAFRAPAWMEEPRGPDVSAELRWYPVVTFLQLAIDIAAADQAPMGYGHVYAPEHYIDAWRAVTDPPGWTESDIERLKHHFR